MNLFRRRSKEESKAILPILVLIGVTLLFFYKTILFGKLPFAGDLLLAGYAPWNHQSYDGYVAGAIPTKNQYFDVIRELYPWKTVVVSQLKHGVMPLWNPYNFSGAPLLANYQSQVFYPLTLLYFVFPQATAWAIMVIIQPVLGSIFLYLFASEIGLSSTAAVLTAILFNFSSFASVWMEFTTVWNTILWLPLLLFLSERGVKQKKLFWWQQTVFIAALFSAITAGHPQDFLNSFLVLLVYTGARVSTMKGWSWKDKISFAQHHLLFPFVIPFFLAAPQLFPTIELFKDSARVSHDYLGIIRTMLVQWWQLPLIVIPDFFGNPATGTNFTGDYVGKTLSVGIVGLSLAVASLWHKKPSWHKTFFALLGILVLLITVRTPISELLYRYPWPVLSTGTPTRVLFVLTLALSILAGFGYDAVRTDRLSGLKAIGTVLCIIIASWIFARIEPLRTTIPYSPDAWRIMSRATLLATGIFVAADTIFLLAKYRKTAMLLFIPLAAAELMYSFLKFNPFVPASFVYPENDVITKLQKISGIDRFWGYGTGAVEANFATQEHLFSPDGTDPLNLAWYNRLLTASKNGNLAASFNRTTRSDAKLAAGYGPTDLPGNRYRLRLMDVLGVKYVLDRAENPKDNTTFAGPRFSDVGHVADWTIYENKLAAPRYFLTSDVRGYTNDSDFEQQFFGNDFVPGSTVLLERNDMYYLPNLTKTKGSANLISYTPNLILFHTSTQGESFLFLGDTFDKGWRATINGKETKVFRANYAFRGMIIPPGESSVVLRYDPASFDTGLALGGMAFVVTLLYFLRLAFSKPRQ